MNGLLLLVGSHSREVNPNEDTHSSRHGGSGDRFLTWGLGSPRAASKLSRWSPSEAHQPQDDEQSQAKEFKGKISKINGRFVLEESSDGGSYGTYVLDDQTTAKKYEGQKVVVTGPLMRRTKRFMFERLRQLRRRARIICALSVTSFVFARRARLPFFHLKDPCLQQFEK